MELGLHFVDFVTVSAGGFDHTLTDVALTAEAGGMTMLTLADHFLQMESLGKAEDPFLEGYTSLGFLAAKTKTITLSMLVTGVTYRYPGVLAKVVATLDVLSRGRSMLGLGAAWYQREHLALGIPFPPLRARFEMLEETVQVCRQMWSADCGPYLGSHYQLAETICQPLPLQRIPIMIGGAGEKKTLRLVAQYADVWNVSVSSVDQLAHKIEVLERHCTDVDRDPAEIRKTAGLVRDPFDDVSAYLREMEQYAALGVDLVNVGPLPPNPDPAGFVARLCEQIVPRAAQIG
ncbi:LLM class F420-dependent oxidoreductase [Mycobacterium vicinigordonae]|uniref:LLM class F420-dependent oxidoreductase n=1 Tax=Mycobacterium vicinigordonae TaxID=1719132 RepID=A0A7D6HY15_9MYCO|nr:LLM class F420-dependent oxidoreductase [Mycobacterium vicinigordonae]QLL05494.1 LLM class F420-dependent oxidoreductase [Mycobacterium vicinigordonae]